MNQNETIYELEILAEIIVNIIEKDEELSGDN